MKAKTVCLFGWAFLLVGLCFTGCSPGGNTVSGEVKLDGKPLPGADLSFESDATSTLGGFAGKTDEQGKFSIPVKSIKAGKYRVLINKYVDKKGKALDPEEMEQMKAAGLLKNVVPPKYNAPGESVLIVDIKDGNNELKPFELKSK